MIFLPEEPGSDYKPSDTYAVQKIIIDGDKDKPDEGKAVGLSNARQRWGGMSFSTELPLDMSSKKITPFVAHLVLESTVLILSWLFPTI